MALEIGKRKKAGQDVSEILNEMKIVSSELSELEARTRTKRKSISRISINNSQLHTRFCSNWQR